MDNWWITTDFFWRGGAKILGPFETQELALKVRALLEFKNHPKTYFVDDVTSLHPSKLTPINSSGDKVK